MAIPRLGFRDAKITLIGCIVHTLLSWLFFCANPARQTDLVINFQVVSAIGLIVVALLFLALCIYIIIDGGIAEKATIYFFFPCSFLLILSQLFNFGTLYKSAGVVSKKALDCMGYFYFSTMTMATVGYGDITPGDDARLIAVIQVLLGYLYLGIFLGLFTSMIMQVNQENK